MSALRCEWTFDEIMRIANRTAAYSHLTLTVLMLVLLTTIQINRHVLAIVALDLLLTVPIPVAAADAVGNLAFHYFRGTSVSIPTFVRVSIILIEVALFGWGILMIQMLPTMSQSQ
ncbi:MAG TPA: hypothetical protein VGM98_07575 [Schlesneria sp.]